MVVLPNGIAISQYEITKGEYAAFKNDILAKVAAMIVYNDKCYVFQKRGNTGEWDWDASKSWSDPGFLQEDNSPVVCVSWNDANAYARWLSEKTGNRYKILTIEEFEFATKAGTDNDSFWTDDNDACPYANINDKQSKLLNGFPWPSGTCDDGYPRQVGSQLMQTAAKNANFRPNPFGLYHSIGNVYEWILTDPHCSVAGQTGIWGGSWSSAPDKARAISGWCQSKEFKAFDIGFRLLRE
jgi:formylglycine-generating enzyme required for sulfatase activity